MTSFTKGELAGVQCTLVFQKWGCCTPVFWRTISTDFLNYRKMNNFGNNKYELTSMQQQYNRKVSIIAFVVSICPIFWSPRGGGYGRGSTWPLRLPPTTGFCFTGPKTCTPVFKFLTHPLNLPIKVLILLFTFQKVWDAITIPFYSWG